MPAFITIGSLQLINNNKKTGEVYKYETKKIPKHLIAFNDDHDDDGDNDDDDDDGGLLLNKEVYLVLNWSET